MKKSSVLVVVGLCLAAAVIFTFSQCGRGAKGEYIKPYEKTSFDEVTANLNPGGSFYLYASTERIVKAVDEFAVNLRKVLETNVAGSPEESTEGLKIFDFIYGMIKNSGLMEVSGIGASSVPLEEKLNHSKFVVHHYKDKNKGLIWQLMDGTPHEMPLLNMLPAETVIAGYTDFEFKTLWGWVKAQFAASDFPKLKQGIMSVEPGLQTQGINLEQLLGSLSGMGFILSFDDANKKSLPIGPTMVDIPDPAIVVMFSVKDESIYNLIKSKLPPTQASEDRGMKKITIPVPPLPIPFTIEPVIIQKGDMLLLASNTKIVEAMLAAQEKGNGLTATEEFKRMSVRIPTKGNSFRFISSRFMRTFFEFQKKMAMADKDANPDSPAMKILEMMPREIGLYGVHQNGPEGTVFIFNHTMGLENVVLLPVTVVGGIVAAIAIPNMLTAVQKGKQKATMGDMLTIGNAIESYMTDNYKAPEGGSLAEIQSQLEPFYIKTLPLKDAWGNDFQYAHGTGAKKDMYTIGSGGKDGVFNGWEQNGFYLVLEVNDFNNDIIFANGVFTYGPKVK